MLFGGFFKSLDCFGLFRVQRLGLGAGALLPAILVDTDTLPKDYKMPT